MLAPRFAMARIIQGILCAPPLARRMAEVLGHRPDLADELVAVTGGLRPPASLMRRGVLVPLLGGMALSGRAAAQATGTIGLVEAARLRSSGDAGEARTLDQRCPQVRP